MADVDNKQSTNNGDHVKGSNAARQRPLLASSLTIQRTQQARNVPNDNSAEHHTLGYCTDHMLTARWTKDSGWSTPSITPYGPIPLSPIASVLQYATTCFEGMKAYRGIDGKVRLFRPYQNAKRFRRSAARVALPNDFSAEEMVKLVRSLVALEADKWMPAEIDEEAEAKTNDSRQFKEKVIYLRPSIFATQAAIGVQRPTEALLVVVLVLLPDMVKNVTPSILQPPPAFEDLNERLSNESVSNTRVDLVKVGRRGIRLLASSRDTVRAWPGGCGSFKVGANYGPSLLAQGEARALGYEQVLWLFDDEDIVTEAGASNFFVVWKNATGQREVATPPLEDGLILDGVTRSSVLELLRQSPELFENGRKLVVSEKQLTAADIIRASRTGNLLEAFIVGTAVFVVSVAEINFREERVVLPLAGAKVEEGKMTNEGTGDELATKLRLMLEGIMYGRKGLADHEWTFIVD